MMPILIGPRFAVAPVVVPVLPVVVLPGAVTDPVEATPVVPVVSPGPRTAARGLPVGAGAPRVVAAGAPSPLSTGALPAGPTPVGGVATVEPQPVTATASRPASTTRDRSGMATPSVR